jgi:CheY-like chemotaxis protein
MAKILLVEDNEINRDMLRRRLERIGYSVIAALDGEQGYSLAQSETADLILMDISFERLPPKSKISCPRRNLRKSATGLCKRPRSILAMRSRRISSWPSKSSITQTVISQ